jgi:Flp pilus assembly protein TadB
MDLSERERRRLTQIDRELVLDAPALERAYRRWSTRPLKAERRRATVRTATRTLYAVTPPTLALGVGVTLLVLGVVHGWLPLAAAGVVVAQFGPVLVARRVRPRRKAAVPTGPDARGATRTGVHIPDAPRPEGGSGLRDHREDE